MKRKKQIKWDVVMIHLKHHSPEIDGSLSFVTDDTDGTIELMKELHGENYTGYTIVAENVPILKFATGVYKIKKVVDRGE